jgi:hypothetical protein
VNFELGGRFALDDKRCGFRFRVLLLVEQGEIAHPSQHVQLALLGAFGIDDRVEGRRGLRQSGEHRYFGGAQLGQRLAKVDLGRGSESVGPLAEVDLVDVYLEDLILAQAILDLERQQASYSLRVRSLARKEEGARPAW